MGLRSVASWLPVSGFLASGPWPRSSGTGDPRRCSGRASAGPSSSCRSQSPPGSGCGRAHQADVSRASIAAQPEGNPVVELEPMSLRTSSSLRVNESTPTAVPRHDRALDVRRDVTRGGSKVGLRDHLARALRTTEAPRFQPFELLRDGLLDQGAHVSVRYLRPHERPQPLQLVVQLSARREMDRVPTSAPGPASSPLDLKEYLKQLRLDGVLARPEHLGPRPGTLLTPSGRGSSASSTFVGSFRILVTTSGRGASSATSSSISRFDRWMARARIASRFSRVRWGASLTTPLRWRRPSPSIVSSTGCSREARAAAIRR